MADEQVQATTGAQAQPQTEPPAAQAAAETTQPVPATTEQAPGAKAQPPEMTLEVALKELKEARAEAAKYRTTAKATEKAKAEAEEAALKEQGKYQTLYEKLKAEFDKAQGEIAKRDRADLQRRVASSVGLPDKLASRIAGETEADMLNDAREMLGALPKAVIGNDAKAGSGPGSAPKTIAGMSKEQAASFLGIDPKYLQ